MISHSEPELECQKHQLEYLYIELNPNTDQQKKFLCIQCVAEIYSHQSLGEIKELKKYFQEIKQKDLQQLQNIYQQEIVSCQTLKQNMYEYINTIKKYVEEVQQQINLKLVETQQKLKDLPNFDNEKQLEIKQILCKKENIIQKQLKIENETEIQFANKIKSSTKEIDAIKLTPKITKELDKLIDKIQDTQHNEVIQQQFQPQIYTNLQTMKCQKHNGNIYYINLNSNDEQRFLCLQCENDCQQKLITVQETNKKWLQYQQFVFEKKQLLNQERESKQYKIVQNIKDYELQITEIQNQLTIIIDIQNDQINDEIQRLNTRFQKEQLTTLDFYQLNDALIQLQKGNQNKQIEEYEKRLKKFDRQVLENIITGLTNLNILYYRCLFNMIVMYTHHYGQVSLNQFLKDQNYLNQPWSFPFSEKISQDHFTQTELSSIEQIITPQQSLMSSLSIQPSISSQQVENQLDCWRFSKKFKNKNIILSKDCKVAKSEISNMQSSLILCDQPIPKNGTAILEFKIHKLHEIYAGICIKDKQNKDFTVTVFYNQNYNKHCCYLMGYDGFTYSHGQTSVKHDFKFNPNDKIIIEVNCQEQRIFWKNYSQKYPTVMRKFTAQSDIYFCFYMERKNKIQLL